MLDLLRRIARAVTTLSPSALFDDTSSPTNVEAYSNSAILHRNVRDRTPIAESAANNQIQLSNGGLVYDASGGAAVSCLGHENVPRIIKAMTDAAMTMFYVPSLSFATRYADAFADFLVESTGHRMEKALIYSSGSDAVDSAFKLARQYFWDLGQKQRVHFIARKQSYHGATGFALSLSGHEARREIFECFLTDKVSHIPACNPWRDRKEIETDEDYLQRKAKELDDEFQRLGPDTVIAFVAEPVVGAALGCVPAPPGYIKAMKQVCDKYGALLILDEIMCGMGRTGYLHAWEGEGVVPDISVVGKGIAAGMMPVSAMLIHSRVINGLRHGSGAFAHGFTYQNHPVICAVAHEVQLIIREQNLMANVRRMGALLENLLHKELDSHPNVGNIRGKGLFLGIEFVKNKETKEPFDPKHKVFTRIHEAALKSPYNIYLYPGNGTADGRKGDHEIIAPPYNLTEADVYFIVKSTKAVIYDVFDTLKKESEQ